jgi:hypothetical protein
VTEGGSLAHDDASSIQGRPEIIFHVGLGTSIWAPTCVRQPASNCRISRALSVEAVENRVPYPIEQAAVGMPDDREAEPLRPLPRWLVALRLEPRRLAGGVAPGLRRLVSDAVVHTRSLPAMRCRDSAPITGSSRLTPAQRTVAS